MSYDSIRINQVLLVVLANQEVPEMKQDFNK